MTHHTPSTDRMVGIRYVVDVLQRSRASIYRDIARAEFPKPLKLGSSSRWLRSDIDRFIAGLADRRAEG